MAKGATDAGDDMVVGRTNKSEQRTRLIATDGDPDGYGTDFVLDVAIADDKVLRKVAIGVDAIHAKGTVTFPTGPTTVGTIPPGNGVVGRGLNGLVGYVHAAPRNRGEEGSVRAGVLGLGDDSSHGVFGRGQNGVVGCQQDTPRNLPFETAERAGVLGRGDIGVSGEGTLGPGVHGVGATGVMGDATGGGSGPGVHGRGRTGVRGDGATGDGAAAGSGPGVLGVGAPPATVSTPGPIAVFLIPPGCGVVGVAGDRPAPPPGAFTRVGVWGEGRSGEGVHGSSADNRGGVFESASVAQMRLVPLPLPRMAVPPVAGLLGDLLVTTQVEVAEAEQEATLWFCKKSGGPGQAQWVKLA